MNKAQKVLLEDNEAKGVTKVQTKSAVVGETSPMSKLQQQVAQLTTLVESAQVGPNKNTSYKGFHGKVIIKTITALRKIIAMVMQECNPRDWKFGLMVLSSLVNDPNNVINVKAGYILGTWVHHV